jgi:hypothetical protein
MPRFGTLLSLLLLGGSFAPIATRPATAAVKEFPYEAVIEADEAYVRCGPGKNFYATMKLTRGQHVTVRRHDPGGWFMIDPPAGSFSLIRMEDVVQQGNTATVKRLDQGQISVRIGSSLDPTADAIFQRKLSSGERAEILGEVIIPRKDRQVAMFRIRPPRGEFRWIEGNDLAPLDPQIKRQQDSDPFSTPPQARQARRDQKAPTPSAATPAPVAASIGARSTAQPGNTTTGTATAKSKNSSAAGQQVVIGAAQFDPRGRLDQIDGEFRDMIQKEPPTWNLNQIELAYLELRQHPAASGVTGQVDLRFSALAHYKQVKSQYDDYYRLVSGTSRRDAELAAVENSLAPQNSRPAVGPTPPNGWPASAPSGEANYQTPTTAPSTPPAMSVPNSSPSPTPVPTTPTDVASPNAAPQSMPEGAGPSQPQSPGGLTLGAPVPMPLESQPTVDAVPRHSPSNAASHLPNTNSPSTSPPNPGSTNSGSAPQTQGSPVGAVPTDRNASDLGIQPFPGEIGPVQASPPPPTTRQHTSQFSPNMQGQSPAMYPAAPSSPAIAPQPPPNSGFSSGLGQPAPTSPFAPSGPMQNQPRAALQNQPYYSQQPTGENAPPFAAQQPMLQPQLQQPSMQGLQQPGMPGAPVPQPFGMQQPSPGPQQPTLPQNGIQPNGNAMPAMAPPRQIHPPGSPPLDGAGIVQAAAATSPNGPRHVLLAPNGRILAYLQAGGGVNLDAYVGRQMGIMGYRAFRADLQADLIIVRGVVPVRLVQP